MIVDPRWYECYIAALTGVSKLVQNEPDTLAEKAETIADAAYKRLLAREAQLASNKPAEIKKGQIWRFKEHGQIRVVSAVEGDMVRMRQIEGEKHLVPFSAKKILSGKDCFLIGQEPLVSTSEETGIATAEDGAATTPEEEQGQSS